MTNEVTFARTLGEPDRCFRCGRSEEEHEWRCDTCKSELLTEPCGCGQTHLPKLCHGSATLRCQKAAGA